MDQKYQDGAGVRLILQIFIVLCGLGCALGFFWPQISGFYLQGQLPIVGTVVNSVIASLFLAGLFRICWLALGYHREEKAMATMVRNLQREYQDALLGVNPDSVAARRYFHTQQLAGTGKPINQSALAAILLAEQSSKNVLPRYTNHILVLLGMFGTLLSLALALTGAANLLQSLTDPKGMGMIIQGMATALSTTMSAIVCYVIFSYFHQRLTSLQSRFAARIERLTHQYLMPTTVSDENGLLHRASQVIDSLKGLIEEMRIAQQKIALNSDDMNRTYSGLEKNIQQVHQTLRQGFRLETE